MRTIDADAMKAEVELWDAESNNRVYQCAMEDMLRFFIEFIDKQPTIESKQRKTKGCSYCKGRAYSKKPLTVITRTMKRVEVVFEYCPVCGRKMNGGAEDA